MPARVARLIVPMPAAPSSTALARSPRQISSHRQAMASACDRRARCVGGIELPERTAGTGDDVPACGEGPTRLAHQPCGRGCGPPPCPRAFLRSPRHERHRSVRSRQPHRRPRPTSCRRRRGGETSQSCCAFGLEPAAEQPQHIIGRQETVAHRDDVGDEGSGVPPGRPAQARRRGPRCLRDGSQPRTRDQRDPAQRKLRA